MGSNTTGRRSGQGFDLTPRRIVAIVLSVLAVVFVVQNREDATMSLLGVSVTGPLWLAALLLVLLGVAIGLLAAGRRSRRS